MSEFEDKLNTILSSPETMEQLAAIARGLGGAGESTEGEPPAQEQSRSAPSGDGIAGLLS
ncbi:MAG: hypothetical protein IJ751_04910 [Oscillospiraceae bacterium]|nr:hypothetical protein [Oscillospiraceae bacterium]